MDASSIPSVAIQVFILVLAVSVHESAHGLAAFAFGDRTAHDLGRISLNPLKHIDPVGSVLLPALLAFTGAPIFGWAKPVPVSLAGVSNWRLANLVVSAAGPGSNFVLAGISTALLGALGGGAALDAEGIVHWIAMGAFLSVVVNLTLAIFNLLPIPPLDGFGVVQSMLPISLLRRSLSLQRWAFPAPMLLMLSGAPSAILGPLRRAALHLFLGAIS